MQRHEECLCLHCQLHLPETQFYKEHKNPLKLIFAGRVKVEEVAALLYYKKGTVTQHILHNLKYNGQKELGDFLGNYFGHQLAMEPRFQDVDTIIPIVFRLQK